MKRMPVRIRTISLPLAGLLTVLVVASTAHAPRPARAQSLQDDPFAVPVGLERAVEFWKKVYGEWSEDEVTFHDRDDLGIVYRTMDQEKSETPSGYAANEAAQEALIAHYRRILLDLATRNPDPRTLSGEYREVYDLFGDLGSPTRWRQAADRIRVQRGLREKFQRGLIHAGQYREHILAIFREEGLPEEIAWLPMVESTFNVEARSKVGAAGVWQFMPGTGRLYMRVDATIDERLDPIIAARGAARLLKHNYQGLGSWPLALTAYNHGYYGMRRAVAQVGTNDYMTIRRLYDGPAFGFASKNFFAEFLAALYVAEHAEQYFGMHEPFRTLEFDVVSLPVGMRLADIASAVQVEKDRLWQMNPSLTDEVWSGRRMVPAGFRLRVPPGYGREAPLQLAASAASRDTRSVRSAPGSGEPPRIHTVRRGDTLSSIATRYGLSVGELIALNDLQDRDVIRVGQRLVLSR
jgi:membrane-bound lytic murein transglycosylase D